MKALERKAKEQGFTVEVRTSGHLRWTAPGGEFCETAKTPGGKRAFNNVTAKLRRIGFDPNWTKPKKEQPTMDLRTLPDRTPIADAKESYQCDQPGCGKRILNSRKALHLREVHNIYWCEPCDRTFTRKVGLGRHNSITHGIDADGNELTPCPIEGCKARIATTSKNSLAQHLRLVHGSTGKSRREAAKAEEELPLPIEKTTETPPIEATLVPLPKADLSDDSMLAVLELLCGTTPTIPISKIGMVNAWMNSTRDLIQALG